MAANQQTPEERFDAWIQSRFAWAQPGTYNIIPGSQTQIPNCFAYAVGVRNRAILAYMWDDLARECISKTQSLGVSFSLPFLPGIFLPLISYKAKTG